MDRNNHNETDRYVKNCGNEDAFYCNAAVAVNERKKSEELRELLGLEPVSLIVKKSMLRWFGHVE